MAKVPQAPLTGDWKSMASNATVRFNDGKISGNDGCNRFGGTYSAQGDTLSISDKMISTMMACEPSHMASSAAFKQALQNAKKYQNDTKILILFDVNGEKLAELQSLSATLEPAKYSIKHYHNGKKGVVGTVENSVITAAFTSDGKLSGNSGCNQYVTSYSIKDDQITIGVLAMTRKLCSPARMEQEQQLSAALTKAATLKRNGEKWDIRDENGSLLIDLIQE
jgi:heat shock protein HslJ